MLLPLTGAPSMISYFAIVSFSLYVLGPKNKTKTLINEIKTEFNNDLTHKSNMKDSHF